jgi:cell division protein FtsN
MPRDYKHRSNHRHSSRSSGISPWLGVIAGLMVGLFVAFLVFIRMQAAPQQQVFVRESLPAPDAAVAEDMGKDTADATPGPPKPRFDFYIRLPEMEVVVPDQEITGKPEQGVKRVEQPGTYYLQVGSFRNGEQADRFKAELALLGLETSIQKVTIDNKNTWHRVRVGPYDDLDILNQARRLLNQRNIESTLVKIRN